MKAKSKKAPKKAPKRAVKRAVRRASKAPVKRPKKAPDKAPRKASAKAPRGFVPIGSSQPAKGGESQAEAARRHIREFFAPVVDALRELGMGVDTRTHFNRDGSVDGQLRAMNVPRKMRIADVLLKVNSMLPSPPRGMWMAVGIGMEPRTTERAQASDPLARSILPRIQGAAVGFTYPRRSTRERLLTAVLHAQKNIARNMEKKGRRKANQLLIRAHWQEDGGKPEWR